MNTLRNLEEALQVAMYSAGGYVLLKDNATSCIYTEQDAAILAEAWRENLQTVSRDDDGYELGQAYTRACNLVQPLRDEDIPDEALDALREESGMRGRLTFGW